MYTFEGTSYTIPGRLPDSASLILGSCQCEEAFSLSWSLRAGLHPGGVSHCLVVKRRPQTKDLFCRGLWLSPVSLEVCVFQTSSGDHKINSVSLRFRGGEEQTRVRHVDGTHFARVQPALHTRCVRSECVCFVVCSIYVCRGENYLWSISIV